MSIDRWVNAVHCGDALEILQELPAESIHACVTDPPFGINLDNREWDDFEADEYQAWSKCWGSRVLRVLKPGAHVLAFAHPRRVHRLMMGFAEAGFEPRGFHAWLHANSFPKGRNVKQAIRSRGGYSDELASEWDDWHTEPKSTFDPIVRFRKPIDAPSVEENVLKHGTGALNIGATRIPTDDEWEGGSYPDADGGHTLQGSKDGALNEQNSGSHEEGRFTPTSILDERQAKRLDRHFENSNGEGPSKYYYVSRASKDTRTISGELDEPHPATKPIPLLEWLVSLVTREGQIVLDPFSGSGTTIKAAQNLERSFVGIEQAEKWCEVANKRIETAGETC